MSDSEDEEKKNRASDGMVRKTRRVRKKRKTSGSSSRSREDADSLFAKAKDLLTGMQDEDEDYGPVSVAEQVRRLKKRKEDDRPLDEVWGTRRRSASWLWIIIVGAILVVVAIVIGVTVWAQKETPSQVEQVGYKDNRFEIEELDVSDGPLGWFNENSVEILEEVKKIIIAINEAEEAKDIEKLVRDSPFRTLNPVTLEARGEPMLTNSLSRFQWTSKVVYSSKESGSKERGYLEVYGTRKDGNPFTAYFVLQEDRLVLDWDATTGWSERSVVEIMKEKPRKPMLVRCLLTKKAGFDQKFGETDYSGYVLSGDVSDNYFFAYVDLTKKRDKLMDVGLRSLLTYGVFYTNKPPSENVKVTLRVVFRETIGEEGQFEIVDHLHDGWVTP